MRKTFVTLIAVALLGLIGSATPPTPAGARCCDVSGCIRNCSREANRTRQHVSAEFEAFERWIANWLVNVYWRGYIGPAFKSVEDTIKATTDAQMQNDKGLVDAQNQHNTTRDIERAALEATQQHDLVKADTLCANTYLAMVLSRVEENTENIKIAGGRASSARGGNAGGDDEDDPIGDTSKRFGEWLDNYCNPDAYPELAERCQPRDAEMVDADVKPFETLFEQDSLITGSPEYEAAEALIKNLYEPKIEERIAPELIASGEAQEEVITNRSRNSRTQLAHQVGLSLLANRTSQTQTEGSEGGTAEGSNRSSEIDEQLVKLLLDNGFIQSAEDFEGASQHNLLKMLSSDQFSGGGVIGKLIGKTDTEVARLMAIMMSVQLKLAWHQYEMLEQQLSIDAARLSLDVENAASMEPSGGRPSGVGGRNGNDGGGNGGNGGGSDGGDGGQALNDAIDAMDAIRASWAVPAEEPFEPTLPVLGASGPHGAQQAMLR